MNNRRVVKAYPIICSLSFLVLRYNFENGNTIPLSAILVLVEQSHHPLEIRYLHTVQLCFLAACIVPTRITLFSRVMALPMPNSLLSFHTICVK